MIRVLSTLVFVFFAFATLSYAANGNESEEFDDVFGSEKGYVHSFFSLMMSSSDNIYNTPDNKIRDTYTIFSAGLGLAFPSIASQSPGVQTAEGFLGGEDTSRFQSFLLYSTDILKYSEYTDNDSQNRRLEGLVKYRFRGGLEIGLLGQNIETVDNITLNESLEKDKYNTTLGRLSILCPFSERLAGNVYYSNLDIHYDAERNYFRNRNDINYLSGFFLPFPRSYRYS